MRHVLIDVTRLLSRFRQGRLPTGVDRVSLAYVEHFAAYAQALIRYKRLTMVLSRQSSQKLFGTLLKSPTDAYSTARRCVMAEWTGLWKSQALRGSVLLNTGHSGLEDSRHAEYLRRVGAKPVFLVHDLIPITHPEYCRPGELHRHVIRMQNVLQSAVGVIANSNDTLECLTHYAARTGYRMPPAVAAPLAPAKLPAPSDIRPMTMPYFVMLGTIEPRKNHWLILQLWRRIVEVKAAQAPRLVIIGQRGWECENTLDMLERCEQLRDFVVEVPSCSDGEVATYLHHAQALLFPSFVEGYGMPLVEAMALGVPVIASNLSVFREIAGDLPCYIDPLDAPAWMTHILDFANPASEERAKRSAKIRNFVVPTWASHFDVVENFIDSL